MDLGAGDVLTPTRHHPPVSPTHISYPQITTFIQQEVKCLLAVVNCEWGWSPT